MQSQWSEGYFTAVDYTYGYYRELSPAFQRFCLLLRGVETPEASANDVHCELGFGQGVSFAIHAAAQQGRFIGTDFNPSHAAHAQRLVTASRSEARALDFSFEELARLDDLPELSSLSLHGIWTWVSRGNRQIILDIARRKLKPGGQLFVSYNCYPGWSIAQPLRQLFALHDRFIPPAGGAEVRVETALAFADALLRAQPKYLSAAPQIAERLKTIQGQNKAYVAHEYFNSEWNCMYFADVAHEVAVAKLEFAGTAVPLDTIDSVCLSADAMRFLEGVRHPLLREQSRDYFVNQQFRRDLYVRGLRRLPAALQHDRLLNTRFVLLQEPSQVPMKVATPLGEAGLQEEIYAAVLRTLADNRFQPKTLREIAGSNPVLNSANVMQAAVILLAMGAVAVAQSDAEAKAVAKACAALNRHICERAVFSNEIEVLASPVIGSGVGVSRFQQLFMMAMAQNKRTPEEWAQQAWQIIHQQGQKIVKEGAQLDTAEANLAELTSQAHAFLLRLPVLQALMVA